MSSTGHPDGAVKHTRTIPEWLAFGFGLVYLFIGAVGFFETGFDRPFSTSDDQMLLGIFAVNPFHNVVHLLVGALGLLLSRSLSNARIFGWLLAVAYGAVFVWGLMVTGDSRTNWLNLNVADDGLHLLSALGGLGIALLPVNREARTRV